MAWNTGRTVRDMLHRAARWFPQHEAAVDSSQRYTYASLLEQARRMAALYYQLGIRKWDRIAFLLYPSAVHALAFWGAVELGAVPVGLHVRESAAVLAKILTRLSPRVLVYDENFAEAANQIRRLVPTITGYVRARSSVTDAESAAVKSDPLIPDDLTTVSPDIEPMPVTEDDPAVIVLSSGTTSLPKGIVHTNRTMWESARGAIYLWHLQPSDAMVNTLSTSFIGWYNLSLPVFNVGAKNIFLGKWDPAVYLQTLQDEGATIGFLIPTMWRMLLHLDLSKYDLRRVRLAGFAGEVMDPTTLAQIRERITPHVVNVYGTTETGSCSAGTVMFEEDMLKEGKLASVGKPMLNSDLRVIRPGGNPTDEVAVGESGEVIIRGPSVASLVWDDPATTQRIFRDGWWYSGDNGRLDQDGYLYLEGRIDDMIISGGINIAPARIEEVLMTHPSVAMAAVVGVPDPVWGQRIKAFVVPKDRTLTPQALDAFVRQSDLSQYQRPREYVFLDDLPRTGTGKINRRALREM